MSTVIRTVSQLPMVNDNQVSSLPDGNLIEMSHLNGDMYQSKAISYKNLKTGIKDYTKEQYNLGQNCGGITIKNVCQNLSSVISGDITFVGTKTFSKNKPKITAGYSNNEDSDYIPNIGYTRKLISDSISNDNIYIGSNTICYNPLTKQGDGFAYGDCADILTASFSTGNPTETNELTANKTGYLRMWGWLADNGSVDAEKAWIMLLGKIKDERGTETWMPLSIQPWIMGAYSQSLQYVSINVPVQKDLVMKIKSGFRVNLDGQGAFQNTGSKTFAYGCPCTFVGNILCNK